MYPCDLDDDVPVGRLRHSAVSVVDTGYISSAMMITVHYRNIRIDGIILKA